jgi:hypothetical protein
LAIKNGTDYSAKVNDMQEAVSVTRLPFARLPGQPPVFLNYLAGSAAVLPFYQKQPTAESVLDVVRETLALKFDRTGICEILRRQTRVFGGDASVIQAIEVLSLPDSVAVITGQQAGLFSGPALAIYKALSALKLCSILQDKGIRAVAVFWIASDDHDLAEITRLVCRLPGCPERPGYRGRPRIFIRDLGPSAVTCWRNSIAGNH